MNSDRGVAQLGSVPLWGSGGRGFESRRSDFLDSHPCISEFCICNSALAKPKALGVKFLFAPFCEMISGVSRRAL